jgi:hypothetical protein
MYKLKTNVPDFEVVDGKFAGRKYRHGQTYQEIPPEEVKKFDQVKAQSEETHSAKTKTQSAERPAPGDKAQSDEGGKKK